VIFDEFLQKKKLDDAGIEPAIFPLQTERDATSPNAL
jgi:hypothetical protein